MKRMKYTAKRYIFSGRYIVRNALVVMIFAAVAALVIFVLNVPGKNKHEGELNEFGAEEGTGYDEELYNGTVSPEEIPGQQMTLVLNQTSMIGDIAADELKQVIAEEQQVQVAAKQVQALTNTKFDMTGKFLTEKDAVNVRAEASPDGEVLARLYVGGTGEVVEVGDEWTKICSDGIVGYVSTDLILMDDQATLVAEDYFTTFAVVKEKVRVRVYGNENSDVYFIAKAGDFFIVDKDRSTKDWTCVRLADGSYGFVASQYVSYSEGFIEAVSMEDIADLKQAKVDYQEKLQAEAKAEQEAREAEAKKKAEQRVASSSTGKTTKTTTVTQGEAMTATVSDLYLLAAIVYAESGGEPYEAQLAVANVVLNRLRSSRYPNNLADVIYQPYQFTACKTKNFANALTTGGSSSALRAAQEAMAGVNNVGDCIGFKFPNAINYSRCTYWVQYGAIMFFY